MYCRKVQLQNGKERWVCVEDGPPDTTQENVNKYHDEAKQRVRLKSVWRKL
ncbi:hypothetical protein [Aquisalibacillus elongatus]|uniref:hypothetical protein n=1 Tax=Aquisalibacillus elongatus TaxID=485577 RepID=UPI001FE6BF62|nr:hypothetical protein [Aquisalibacillus elongatus]